MWFPVKIVPPQITTTGVMDAMEVDGLEMDAMQLEDLMSKLPSLRSLGETAKDGPIRDISDISYHEMS